MGNDLWRWADPSGQQRKVRLDELRASLAAGIIAPNAPVWRTGWTGWRQAHEVPELTSASVGGATGVVLNIPPPPLAMVAVQQQYEAAADSILPSPSAPEAEEEPPPPPAYVPAPTKSPSLAPTSSQVKTQLGGPAFQRSAPPPPPPPAAGGTLATQLGVPPPPSDPLLVTAPLSSDAIEELSASALVEGSSPDGVNRVSTDGLGMPAPTLPILLTPGEPLDPALLGLPRRGPLAPILDDLAALRRGEPARNKRALVVVGVLGVAVLVLLVAGVASLVGGPEKPAKTASAKKPPSAPAASASATATTASAALTTAPPTSTPAAVVVPPPPPPEPKASEGPVFASCATSGDDRVLAPRAAVASGIEAQAVAGGLAVGFSTGGRDGVVLALDPESLAVTSTVRGKAAGDVRRVTPMLVSGKLVAQIDADRRGDKIGVRRVAGTPSLVDLGVVDGNVVWAPHAKDTGSVLFSLEGDTPIEALRVFGTSRGVALAFRRGNAIHVGAAKGDASLEAEGDLSRITGLGQTGSPAVTVSGDRVVVAWADRTGAGADWVVRWARTTLGGAIASSEARTLAPAGGPGGPLMSPALAALGGGRFLVAWSEGPVSGHQIRATTIDEAGTATPALNLSEASENAGQPAVAIGPDGRGLVAFLAAKGKGFELRATPILCK